MNNMFCIRCDGEQFFKIPNARVPQEYRGASLVVTAPVFMCSNCGLQTVDMECLEALRKNTEAEYAKLGDANPTQSRFENVLWALNDLKRNKPECDSEVDIAKNMIFGSRPNIEEKYDALLFKLDRTYHQLMDRRDHLVKIAAATPLFQKRRECKTKAHGITMIMQDLQWMKARNRDLIKLSTKTKSND